MGFDVFLGRRQRVRRTAFAPSLAAFRRAMTAKLGSGGSLRLGSYRHQLQFFTAERVADFLLNLALRWRHRLPGEQQLPDFRPGRGLNQPGGLQDLPGVVDGSATGGGGIGNGRKLKFSASGVLKQYLHTSLLLHRHSAMRATIQQVARYPATRLKKKNHAITADYPRNRARITFSTKGYIFIQVSRRAGVKLVPFT